MITKESRFAATNEYGPTVLPLFNRATDAFFEKTASHFVVPEVLKYIETVRPENDACYTLVNALGASEFYSSNSNADAFPESSLIHRPDRWTGNPLLDASVGKQWAYGFPTFYGAHAYPHHRNKDPNKSLGDVTFVCWNDRMKRVELVTRVTKDRCLANGGQAIWDKLQSGQYAEVSMGSRVPGDLCCICADWDAFRKAKATFDPKRHPYEGAAVLEYHKKHPIRGWAITRKEYCEHMLKTPNKILPDGRKVFVYNDYPRFFDISYVFIGADKTAKTLMHLSRPGMISSPSDAFIKKAARLFPGMDKTAAATPKTSAVKSSEMYKEDIPSQFIPAAVATVTRRERDLPDDVLHRLSDSPLESMLATLGSAGVVLRPREFQRVVLIQGGMGDLADKLDSRGSVFPRCSADPDFHLSHGDILPDVVKEILPFLPQRSALKEPLHIRVVISSGAEPPPVKTAAAPSLLSEPLRKISSRYTSYRSQLMETLSHAPTFLSFASDTGIGGKVASKLASELFSPLTVGYIQSAFWDEVAPPPLLNWQEPA